MNKVLVYGNIPLAGVSIVKLTALQGFVAALKKHEPSMIVLDARNQLSLVKRALQDVKNLAEDLPPLFCLVYPEDAQSLQGVGPMLFTEIKLLQQTIMLQQTVILQQTPSLTPGAQAKPPSPRRTKAVRQYSFTERNATKVHTTSHALSPKQHLILKTLFENSDRFTAIYELGRSAGIKSNPSVVTTLSTVRKSLPPSLVVANHPRRGYKLFFQDGGKFNGIVLLR